MNRAEHSRSRVVPERVRLRAEQTSPQTRQWLKDLPGLLAELEQAWELSIGLPLRGGSSAYVAPVQTASGNAVIKIAMPIQHSPYGFQQEIDTLLRAGGHGFVRVFKFDYQRRALLLELWDKLERPCSENIVSVALEFARRRQDAFDPQRCVVVHGDPHPANALLVCAPRAGAESGYVFVDPESFLCDPAYDLGVVMRDWNEELLAAADPLAVAHHYCQLLATESGLDEATIWEWGFIERVSSGLYICAYGSREHGQPFFTTAQRLLSNSGVSCWA